MLATEASSRSWTAELGILGEKRAFELDLAENLDFGFFGKGDSRECQHPAIAISVAEITVQMRNGRMRMAYRAIACSRDDVKSLSDSPAPKR